MVVESKPKLVDPEFTKAVVDAGADTVTLCFQCGTCTGGCPSGRVTAFRTRKLMRRVQLGFKDDVLPSDELWLCTTCTTCDERCPRGVKITDIIMTLRNMAVREGHMAESHRNTARMLVNSGHAIPLSDTFGEMRKKLGLDEAPPTVLSDSGALEEVKKLVKATGFEELVG
ncbi:MAG: CoB--CoM heterodisulfide reductase subunit C [Thermoplasmata archaeon]